MEMYIPFLFNPSQYLIYIYAKFVCKCGSYFPLIFSKDGNVFNVTIA